VSARQSAKMRGMMWAKLYRDLGSLYPEWPPPVEVAEIGDKLPVSEDDPADPFPSRADEGDEFSLLEIGETEGVSHERIRQIESQALGKLRAVLTREARPEPVVRSLTKLESIVLRNIRNGLSPTDGRTLRGLSEMGANRALARLVRMGKVT